MGKKLPVSFEAGPDDLKQLAEQDAALAANPNDIVANCSKGIILIGLGRSEEALECFERALQQDQSCMYAWIGKGRALSKQEDYVGADACFNMVPKGDEYYDEARRHSDRNKRYRDRRGQAQAGSVFNNETELNKLERWMDTHLDSIRNLHVLLHKFRCAKDGHRRKDGNVLHAFLVRRFYEYGGPLKVVAVERDDIEPNTDVDIELSNDIYIQVWYGKIPMGHTVDVRLWSGDRTPLDMDWSEELRPIRKKLRQLPSNIGKGFVINFTPGTPTPASPPLHQLCSERNCVMSVTANISKPHIIVTGTSDFKYRDEVCQIARMLCQPVRFILSDWDVLHKQGRNPMSEAAYGHDVLNPPYADLANMYFGWGQGSQPRLWFQTPSSFNPSDTHNIKQRMLTYAKDVLKHPSCDELAKLDCGELYDHLSDMLLQKDSDCPDNESTHV